MVLMTAAAGPNDALAGDPRIVGASAAAAGVMQTLVLLPLNTVQTNMQHKGLGLTNTLRAIFVRGPLSGAKNLYGALPPTVVMVGMRHGLIFGGGSKLKQRLPIVWPEPARDAVSMASSAFICSCFLFPIDTIKTRMQLQMALPQVHQLFSGFAPAVSHAIFGRALWMVSRNSLEHRIPNPVDPRLLYWKHFCCGGFTGAMVTAAVFPLDTLKKRLQAPPPGQTVAQRPMNEAKVLFADGGVWRFYRGAQIKVTMNFLQGACFNVAFVVCRKALESSGFFT